MRQRSLREPSLHGPAVEPLEALFLVVIVDAASLAGYRCFSSPHAFRKYVKDEILHDPTAEAAEEAELVGD